MKNTFDVDTVPAPSDIEMAALDAANAKRREFVPFVAVKHNRLLTIIGKTARGHYMDRKGYLHRIDDLDLDLRAYAERARADARDQADTFADALR